MATQQVVQIGDKTITQDMVEKFDDTQKQMFQNIQAVETAHVKVLQEKAELEMTVAGFELLYQRIASEFLQSLEAPEEPQQGELLPE